MWSIVCLFTTTHAQGTILNFLATDPDLTHLYGLLNDTDYKTITTLLDDDQANVTLFAPSNSAFGEDLIDLDSLLYHILAQSLSLEIVYSQHVHFLATIQGSDLQILADEAESRISIVSGKREIATVLKYDIATNGVLYVIDNVLTPPTSLSLVADQVGNLTGFLSGFNLDTELLAYVEANEEWTIFAPIDPTLDPYLNLGPDQAFQTFKFHL